MLVSSEGAVVISVGWSKHVGTRRFSAAVEFMESPMDPSQFAKTLESTLLSPNASAKAVDALCAEAAKSGFHGVCVSPCRAALALERLKGSGVRVVSVAGFPLGTQTPRAKAAEVAELVELGVDEVDLVMNVGWFLEKRLSAVSDELRLAREACGGRVFKVILETGSLTLRQIAEAGALALGAGADFLKTSTGYGPRGAEVRDVEILRQVAGDRCGIKASGGIRSYRQAAELLAAGATRIGTSSAGVLLKEARDQ